ncbi:hypothetical protein [Pseudomonas schmalbachii]|uniref:Uncharacterized protein n=1 Tax=Pseudomonas schmalbachii TaxID=2816993 RepID=A0ABS3TKA7_9PSED|nr:hypothetical protein [Pseudomonas schmalbachii]MBO3274099.1 hypothetical protein [Pseudomonas schmalbachii]
MNKPNNPQMPFIWPEPLGSTGVSRYETELPFEVAAQAAQCVFGVVSAIDARATDWMERYLADNTETRLRLVVSIHPTCRTSESDLQNLLHLVERYGDRAAFKVFPEASLFDRSSNLLCLCGVGGDTAVSVGPTENMGFAPTSPSQANLASVVTAATFEACRKWFDYLWGIAGPLHSDVATAMPNLVLPEGDVEAARQWEDYRRSCLNHESTTAPPVRAVVDPESGEVVLVDQNNEAVPSPTEAIGVPKLDPLAEYVARVFELGALVSVDKLSRIPPLEAPVKPEWFGVDSFRQTGMVRAQTSIKVAPFDEATLKKIDRLRRVSGELLPHYSFALADGVRWIPKQAIPLFEAALTAANEDAKKILGQTIGDDIQAFLGTQRERIRNDAQRMYETYHPGGKIPDNAVTNILDELKARLDKTKADKLIPKVAYSPVAFNPSQQSEWSSPWGQAFALLKGIAEFPREAMTNRFFWQGIRTDEDVLIQAMNVARDYLVEEYGGRKAKQRAELELDLIKQLENASGDTLAKCQALWSLITTGKEEAVLALVADRPVSCPA